jgi:hypothetical protein
MKISHLLIAAAVACGFAATPVQAGSGESSRGSFRSNGSAHLVIERAPDFGTEEHFNLYIDGRYVATIGYNQRYEGFFPPGDHIATIKQMPHLNDAYPFTHTRIRLVAGRTNVFTATWRNGGENAVLEPTSGMRPPIM